MNKPKVEIVWLALLLFLPSLQLMAGEEEETPSIELLEFIGDWQTPEGDYFDPLILAEENETQPETETKDEN